MNTKLPYIVDPDELDALGIDPDLYFKSGSNKRGTWVGWILDRTKDAALIIRLQAMQEPHRTVQ
jgi:hypothetical protein